MGLPGTQKGRENFKVVYLTYITKTNKQRPKTTTTSTTLKKAFCWNSVCCYTGCDLTCQNHQSCQNVKTELVFLGCLQCFRKLKVKITRKTPDILTKKLLPNCGCQEPSSTMLMMPQKKTELADSKMFWIDNISLKLKVHSWKVYFVFVWLRDTLYFISSRNSHPVMTDTDSARLSLCYPTTLLKFLFLINPRSVKNNLPHLVHNVFINETILGFLLLQLFLHFLFWGRCITQQMDRVTDAVYFKFENNVS